LLLFGGGGFLLVNDVLRLARAPVARAVIFLRRPFLAACRRLFAGRRLGGPAGSLPVRASLAAPAAGALARVRLFPGRPLLALRGGGFLGGPRFLDDGRPVGLPLNGGLGLGRSASPPAARLRLLFVGRGLFLAP